MPPKKADKKGASSQQDISQPYVCTGSFYNDFGELCRRKGVHYAPEVLLKPKPHPATSHATDGKETTKKGKEDKKAKVEVVDEQPELDEFGYPLPKTFAISKNKFHYFKPCVQVEMDNPDKLDTVTEMYIRGWKLDSAMLEILHQCWVATQRLHTISLWNVGMDSDGVFTLARCLPQCSALKTLIFDGNHIKEENYFEFMGDDSPLLHLSLRHCGISDVGATKIAACIGTTLRATNSKLLTLNLAGNHISDLGACALADALQMNRTLLSLTLSGNQIGDFGAERFAQSLSRIPLSEVQIQTRRLLRFERYYPIGSQVDRSKSVSPVSRRSDSKMDSARPGSVKSAADKDRSASKNRDKSSSRVARNEAPAKGAKDDRSGAKKKEEKGDKTERGKKDKVAGSAEPKPVERKASRALLVSSAPAPASVPPAHSTAVNESSDNVDGGAVTSDVTGRSARSGGKQAQKTSKAKTGEPLEISELAPTPLLDDVDLVDGQLWLRGNFTLFNLNLSRNKMTEAGLSKLLKMVHFQNEVLSRHPKQPSGPTGLLRLVITHNGLPLDNPVYVALQDAMLVRDPFYKPSGTPMSEDASGAAASVGHTREHTARSGKRD